MKIKQALLIILLLLPASADILAQIHVPLDMRGNRKYRKESTHNGNNVETLFYNFGEVAWWGRQPSGVWPKGSGHSYMDGISPIVVAEVKGASGKAIHIDEAGYRENMDVSPTGIERGWQPRPGYANPNQDEIALSDKPKTWPEKWADKDESWNGYWNGYFGKRTNADQESWYVVDDQADDGQDFYPDSTDRSRRGLGLKMGVRGFQWSNLLAQDLIFWHYEITNEGTTDYDKIIFGMYVDCGIGGYNDSNDDLANFDTLNNIAYSWDYNGIGDGGWAPTGYAAYAFLESPGNSTNGIDDDHDGMTDESREDGIDNNSNWNAETDDVGLDGVPGTGDFGEGDGKPTSGWQQPGLVPGAPTGPVNKYGLIDTNEPGEPGIDKTDKDESDQIGLTAFDGFYVGSGVAFRNDDIIWERMSYHHFVTQTLFGNVAFLFGSGPFILRSGSTERFSLCLVFGQDLQAIQRNKITVQSIYNNNYNFARPPDKPTVTAVAGDKKVTLYWDNKAEKSYDSFLKKYDFEGYKIYKSTDPGFLDARLITDGYGDATIFKPSAQFDIQNDVKGFFPLDFHGVKLYMGDNKGLQHSWTDYDVINGQTYYYAVVSYDKGDASIGLYPSEVTKVVIRDLAGNVTLDKNTVMVVPGTPSLGYEAPGLKDSIIHNSGFATGSVWTKVIDPNLVRNKNYFISFDNKTHKDTLRYSLYSVQNGDSTLIIQDSPYTQGEDANLLFDGMRLFVQNDTVAFLDRRSGWRNNASNLVIVGKMLLQGKLPSEGFPSSYELRVGEPDSSWRFGYRAATNFQIWDKYNNTKVRYELRKPASYTFGELEAGDIVNIWLQINGSWKQVWEFDFVAPPGGIQAVKPAGGAIADLTIGTPFKSGDTYSFATKGQQISRTLAASQMDKIAVVPNPYVGAARWEPQRLTNSGRGERRIYFINLPQTAEIRIFTISGDHVTTLYHNSTELDGKEPWDMTSKEGLDVAAGVYIFHVTSPGLPEKIDKFALIK
ncbi:MAG: hypothetical protein HF314_15895 [Ignavibacteria bacterium]|jgi:hypothetical protein|nr:hypothetical protein [Ignavibacteria bacterium]MCU7504563.1 hypothetical protein [Ignavibacteria bacterium]MCU7516599.1 hypothetical protein [Ignavibacteria bacterium]